MPWSRKDRRKGIAASLPIDNPFPPTGTAWLSHATSPSGEVLRATTSEQASHEDSSHVRVLSHSPRGHANSPNRPPVFWETHADCRSRPGPAARLPPLVISATPCRSANDLDGIL